MSAPSLRFKLFTDKWHTKKIKDIATVNQGLQIPISNRFYENSENRYFYITNEFLKPNSKVKYFIENPPKSVLCNEEDILMTRTGNTGQVVSDVSGAFHNNFFKINYDKTIISKNFLLNFLKLKKTQHTIMTFAGQSTIPDLNHSDFYKINISYPSLSEQEHIGLFFYTLERKILLQQGKINLLKRQKKGFMQKIFSQELRFKDVNGLEYSKWENKKIGDIATITMGQSPNSAAYSDNSSDTVLVQGNADLKLGKIVPRIYTSEITKMSELGDILLTVRAPVGVVAKTNIPACIGRGVCSIQSDDFLYYYLDYFNMTDQWNKLSQGSTFESVNSNDIKSIYVPQPSIEEKQKITSIFELLTKKIDLAESSLIELQKQKQTFMQQMFI